MTEAERKGTEAERIMGEIAPYCDAVEQSLYRDMLAASDDAVILETRRQILALHMLKANLQTAITLGKQAAKPRVSVA